MDNAYEDWVVSESLDVSTLRKKTAYSDFWVLCRWQLTFKGVLE